MPFLDAAKFLMSVLEFVGVSVLVLLIVFLLVLSPRKSAVAGVGIASASPLPGGCIIKCPRYASSADKRPRKKELAPTHITITGKSIVSAIAHRRLRESISCGIILVLLTVLLANTRREITFLL